MRLFQTIDEPWGLAYALCDLGMVAYYAQCYDEVGRWYQEGVQVARRLGDNSMLAYALHTWDGGPIGMSMIRSRPSHCTSRAWSQSTDQTTGWA